MFLSYLLAMAAITHCHRLDHPCSFARAETVSCDFLGSLAVACAGSLRLVGHVTPSRDKASNSVSRSGVNVCGRRGNTNPSIATPSSFQSSSTSFWVFVADLIAECSFTSALISLALVCGPQARVIET